MGIVVTSYSFTEEEIEGGLDIIVADDDRYGYEVTLQGDGTDMFSISLAYHEWSRNLAIILADAITTYVDNESDKEAAIDKLWTLEYTDIVYENETPSTEEVDGNMHELLKFLAKHAPSQFNQLHVLYDVETIKKEAQVA